MEIGFSNLASVPNNHFRHCTLEFDVQENQTDSQWADCAHGTSVSKHDPASADDRIDVVSADGEIYVTATTMLNEEEEDNLGESPLSYELQQGYRILRELMTDSIKSVNWPFMYRVDDSYPETHDYYERVQNPMWLMRNIQFLRRVLEHKMNVLLTVKDKFEQRSYNSITEFVADFRLMLENCYRYNGPDHYISKRGQKLETVLEQKLALLSRELRAKTTIAATTGKATDDDFLSSGLRRRPKTFIPHDSSALLSQLRNEEAQREREQRRQLIADRKAANEAVQHEILEWEDSLLAEPIKTHMLHSWELPQIGLFLFLCQEVLNLGEVSLFELERCLAMPRQSTTLQYIMTSLLSTPSQRMKIDKKSVMPYRVWTQKLTKKMDVWYKTLEDCNGDKGKAAYKLGFDPCSFVVLGLKNPLRRRAFHKNNFYRRIWILKCLCDHCLETQECLRNAIEAQPPEDQREYILGNDAKGYLYLHFPQFCGADLRIYRQRKPPDLSFSSDEDDDMSIKEVKVGTEKPGVESSFSSKDIHKGNSSLISSPEPRENGKKVKKRATRHPSVPEQSSPELATALWLTGTENRIRKTRNSVEASLPFILGNRSCTNGSWQNKRSKMVKSSVSESSDKSCSNSDVYDIKEEKVAGDNIKCESRDSSHTLVDEFVGCDSKAKSVVNASSSRTEHGESKESVDFLAAREEPALLHSMKKKLLIFDEDKGEEYDAVKVNVKNLSDSHITKTTKYEPCDVTSDHNVIDRKLVEEECADDSSASALELSSLVCDIKRENAVICSGSNCDSSSISEVPARNCSSSQKTSAPSTNSAHEKESVINNHAVFCNLDLMSHTTLKESDDKASRDLESSVRSALLDHVSYSMSVAIGKKCTGKDDILEEDEEDNNEIGPDLDEFELIVDSVEGLQELIQQFAEPQPLPPSSDTSRKARKQRMSKPPQRKPCEVALHERLALLLKELQPWESKLVQASRRMRIKIRREFEDFKEEPMEEAEGDGWETETEVQSSEEAGEGDSSGEDDAESRDSQDHHRLQATAALSSAKKKGPSATPSTASDLTEAEQRDVEEYELDVSSRGRLRKRRFIPNNVEDQGIKKRKITKKTEEGTSVSSVHVPNILQKAQIGKHLAFSAPELANKVGLSSSQAMQTTMNTVENSHLENVVSSQGLRHMQSPSHSTVVHPEATVAGVGAAKQNSHPEIQKLLSVRRPIVVRDRYAPYKMVQKSAGEGSTVVLQNDMSPCNTSVHAQGASAKGISITVSSSNADQASSLAKLSPLSATKATKGASNHPGATMVVGLVGGKPHLVNLSSLPPSVLQQLVRTNTLRLQALSTSAASQNSTATVAVSKPPKSVCSIPSSSLNPTPAPFTTAAVTCGQPSLSSTPVGRGPLKVGAQQTGTLVLKEVTPGANLIPVRMQGVPKVMGPAKTVQGLAISVTSGAEAPGNSVLVAASSVRPHVSLLGSPGRQAQRYAGNVTVRTLLENRAGRKLSDDTSPEKQESLDEPQSPVDKDTQGAEHLATTQEVTTLESLGTSLSSITTVPVTPVASSLLATSPPLTTSVTMAMIGGSVPSGLITKTVPGVLRLPSQSTLDCAVRSVITSCMTTLPTANIKVPSPTTLPNLSPRKNVTKTVQSMKAPIPITTRINSRLEEPTSLVTPTSSGGSSTSGFSGSGVVIPGIQSVGTLSTVATSSLTALPGAVVVQTGNEGALLESADQKQVLVRVMPQGAAGSHTFVQGIATSQGIVLPQTAILKVIQPQGASLDTSRDAQPAIQGQQLPSSPVKVAASSTLPLGAPATAIQGSLSNTITTNKTTAEVIRTMLAAKTSLASPVTPLSVITTQAASDYIVVGPQGSQNTTRLLMQAPLSSVTGIGSGSSSVSAAPSSVTSPTLSVQQQGAETQGQGGPRIITTQLTNLGSTQGPSVPGAGAVRQIHIPVGQVSRLLSGIQVTSLPLTPQQNQVGVRLVGQPVMPPKTEKVMATSLPTGLQIRGLTGPSVVHLVSPGQAASGSAQPVVATLQAGTSGVVGLQQLQLLPSVSGFQKVHVISPQQAQMIAVNQLAATSAVAGHQVRMAIPPGHSSGQMTQGSAAPIKGPGSDKVDGLTLPGATCMKLQAVVPTSSGQVQQGLAQVCLKVQPALVPGSSVAPTVLGKPSSMQAAGIKMVPPKSASSNPSIPVVTITSAVSPVVTITSSVSPLSVPSSTVPSSSQAAASSSVTWCGTLPSSNLSSSNSGSILTPKTVVAAVVNPTLIVSGQAQPRPATPASSTVHTVNSHQASVKSLLGHPVIPSSLPHATIATRFQMTITPDPKTGHLTVRPQLLPSAVALKSAQNLGTSAAEMSSSECPSSSMQAAAEGTEGEMGATERLSANTDQLQKGGLTISALGDGPGGLSGAVLASLSQMVGAKIARQTGSSLSAQDNNIQGIVSAAFKMAQAPVSPANQIQESSQALISLASHTALQQQQQQQPQTLVMKAVPRQINIPVTVSSGIYRVLPKTTPQVGNQATVLNSSNSMVQSLKDPVTMKVMVSKANGDQKPLTVGSFTEQQHDEAGSKASSLFPSSHSDSVLVHSSFLSHLDSDMQIHVEGMQSSKATPDTDVSINFGQSPRERGNAAGAKIGVGHLQRSTLGSNTCVAESLSGGTSVSTLDAPLVKVINGATSEAVTKSMEQTPNSDATTVSGSTGGQELEVISRNSNVSGDILMEKEQAALNLLTLANQFHLN